MPIFSAIPFEPISDQEFAVIDQAVMQCAYEVHNKFGRRFDERIYENTIAAQLRADGFAVSTQVPLRVTHGNFEKIYYLDLVVNDMLYEIKAVASLTKDHEAQCLNYAVLQNVRLAKLLNFGENSVRGKLLCNATYNTARRYSALDDSEMRLITPNCELLLNSFLAILTDWGTHLSSNLYNAALIDALGGEDHCARRVEVRSGSMFLGTHRIQFYANGLAFIVTTLSRDQDAYQKHLNILLTHSQLNAFQWINLNHSAVEIKTIEPHDNLNS